MNWIKHVREHVEQLDVSPAAIRKFALLMGGILGTWTGYAIWKGDSSNVVISAGVLAILLMVLGFLKPSVLRPVYRGWMTLAFAMGWVVSHVILIAFYFMVMTQVALLARVWGKKFMDVSFDEKKHTYWVRRPPQQMTNYEKMY